MSKSEFLDIAKLYTERYTTQLVIPGWNKWALYVALASLFWLFVDLFVSNQLDYLSTVNTLYFLMSAYTFASLMFSFFGREAKSGGQGYKSDTDLYAKFKFTFFFQLIVFAFFLCHYLIFPLINTLNQVAVICSLIFFILLLFIPFLARILRLDYYTSDSGKPTKKGKRISNMIFFVILIASISSSVALIREIIAVSELNNLKAAFILFGGYFVILKIIQSLNEYPLLLKIDNLIDKVVFDKITADEGFSEIRMIVIGMEARDILAKDINDFLESCEEVEISIAKMKNHLEFFQSTGRFSKEDFQLRTDAWNHNISETTRLFNDLSNIVAKINAKIFKLVIVDTENLQLEEFTVLLNTRFNEISDQWSGYRSAFNDTVPAIREIAKKLDSVPPDL